MAATTDTLRFRQGAGRLCLDFVRTLRHRGTPQVIEELSEPAALGAWLRQFDTCELDPGYLPTQAHLQQARELREAVYDLIAAARIAPGALPAGATERVNEAAARPVPAPHLTETGQLTHRAAAPAPATFALIARDVIDLVATDTLTKVRGCANPDCRALFVDNSRPGTRRWCSMDTCGNQAKKNTFRGRTTAGH